MINTKDDLRRCLAEDARNYVMYSHNPYFKKIRHQLHTNPISDQWYIWKYISTLRYCEYYQNATSILKKILSMYYNFRLRQLSRITSFQIPPNTVGAGLTIWHWGTVIINPETKIGRNCTLNPQVVIGHKKPGEGAPHIGNNVFIGAGAKVIGAIEIGDNVIIAPNSVVVKDIPDNCIVGGVPCKILKKK